MGSLPDDDLFEPKSPALICLLKEVAEDEKARSSRDDSKDDTNASPLDGKSHTMTRPFKFAGLEAAEMKQYQAEQIEEAIKHELKGRGIKLRRAGASPRAIQSQPPAFVDLYMEMFGACYDGAQGINDMINKRAHLFVGASLGLAQVSPNGRALVPSVALANNIKGWSSMSSYLRELAWASPRCRQTGAL